MASGYHAPRGDPKFPVRSWVLFARLYARIRAIWLAALREHTSPRELAASVALGVFIGCTPLIGFHGWLGIGAATLLRLNRLWALIGTRISMLLFLPWIILAEVQTSHRLRTGAWAPLSAKDAIEHAREWLLDWCLGTIPVGTFLALALGGVAYGYARARDARQRTPAPPRGPSSESPPSGSPAPRP
jgi:uncharacterized protein (DUF2062 family)